MTTFPTSLPTPLVNSFEASATDPWVSDPAEVGSDRRRARFTRALKSFSFTLRLTDAQRATLITFYDTTLSFGVDSFTWTDPRDSSTLTVRFSQRPRETSITRNIWDVEISLMEI